MSVEALAKEWLKSNPKKDEIAHTIINLLNILHNINLESISKLSAPGGFLEYSESSDLLEAYNFILKDFKIKCPELFWDVILIGGIKTPGTLLLLKNQIAFSSKNKNFILNGSPKIKEGNITIGNFEFEFKDKSQSEIFVSFYFGSINEQKILA